MKLISELARVAAGYLRKVLFARFDFDELATNLPTQRVKITILKVT